LAYITVEYYLQTYNGIPIDGGIFNRISERASDIVDDITFNRVLVNGIESYSATIQTAIKKATCAIAEALGQIDTTTGSTGFASPSEKVGSYSYTGDADTEAITVKLAEAKATSKKYLFSTGLLYSGIGCV